MTTPLDTQVDIEDMWHGYESVGRNSGEPGFFLYYGEEGVDKNYTVKSVVKQFDGWGWTGKISNHGSQIVFSPFLEDSVDPLDDEYEDEILDFLQVQNHREVRVVASGSVLPTDAVDDEVDEYTVIVDGDDLEYFSEHHDDSFDWFATESSLRDRVDFVIGYSGKSRVRDDIEEIRRKYVIPDERVWLYPEEGSSYEDTAKIAKEKGLRLSLRPNYFKDSIEGIDEEEDEGTDD